MLPELILFTFNVAEMRSIYLRFNLRLYNKRDNIFEVRKPEPEKTTLNRLYHVC
jgi:hypothetical protein